MTTKQSSTLRNPSTTAHPKATGRALGGCPAEASIAAAQRQRGPPPSNTIPGSQTDQQVVIWLVSQRRRKRQACPTNAKNHNEHASNRGPGPRKLHLPRRGCGQRARSTPKHHKKWRARGVGYGSLGNSRPSCGLTERPQLRNELRQPHRASLTSLNCDACAPSWAARENHFRVSRPKSLQRNLAAPSTSVPKRTPGQNSIYDLTAALLAMERNHFGH